MYEFVSGAGRLSFAVYAAANDESRIKRLADVLHYIPEQLVDDAQAAADYFERFRSEAVKIDQNYCDGDEQDDDQ